MALFINGVGQDTFSMNGVSIDNLYVDGVLVWSSTVGFSMTVTSSTQPQWTSSGTLIYDDNGDGTWHIHTNDTVTLLQIIGMAGDDISNVTEVIVNSAPDLVTVREAFAYGSSMKYLDLSAVDTSQFTDCYRMLFNCGVLTCLTNLDTTNSSDNDSIFEGCVSLERPDTIEKNALTSVEGYSWVNSDDCPIQNVPVITILGDNPAAIEVGDTYIDAGATATDVEDGDLTSEIITQNYVDENIEGSYIVQYTVTDSDGNTTVAIRNVSVEELAIPRYEMTVPLVTDGTFDYVDDDTNGLTPYDGKLTESDGTTPYLPTVTDYPQNGTLLLDTGRIMDTQLIMDEQKAVYGIWDVDYGNSYKIACLEPVSPGIVNVYQGDQDTPLVLTDENMAYILPVDSWKIYDTRPDWAPAPGGPGIGDELWNGQWDPDSGYYFEITSVPEIGEACGIDNFSWSGSFHYMTQKEDGTPIDVTSANSVRVVRDYGTTGVSPRYPIMCKTTSDGLCRWLDNVTSDDRIIDTSDIDYLIFYVGLDEGTGAPSFSVIKES